MGIWLSPCTSRVQQMGTTTSVQHRRSARHSLALSIRGNWAVDAGGEHLAQSPAAGVLPISPLLLGETVGMIDAHRPATVSSSGRVQTCSVSLAPLVRLARGTNYV